jgi:enoyl-CoA hydratase/carnithine racemase
LTLPALCSKLSAQFEDDCKQDIPMANLETLLFEKNDGVAKITLNRPGAANGINLAKAKELLNVAIDCDDDPEVRAVLITGAGKMFVDKRH